MKYKNMDFKGSMYLSLIIWVKLVAAEAWSPGIPKSLSAAWGRDVCLPCGGYPIALDGPNAYIQWLKDDVEMVGSFSYDELTTTRGDTIPIWCSTRGSLRLHISENEVITGTSDYRCRVHYQYAPPVDFLINLTYIEPPQLPKIFNDRQEEITWGFVGPFLIGSDMRLMCQVKGGKPEPQVIWRRDGKTIRQSSGDYLYSNPIILDVLVLEMGREEEGARFECLAMNSELSEPLRASVDIKMYLPPLSVNLKLVGEDELVAGELAIAECTVVGSYPPPSVSWFIGSNQIAGDSIEERQVDDNVSVSTIKFTPLAAHHNHKLSCHVQNQYLRDPVIEDAVCLHVQYPPIVSISMEGDNISEVVENHTMKLKCSVDANPRPYKLIWDLNGYRDVSTNVKEEVTADYFTNIMKIKRSESGTYTCMASNVQGDGESNALNIVVAYKPICVRNQQVKYGIIVNELENISCILESIPKPKYFIWTFDYFERARTIPRKMLGYENRYVSTLTFKPDQDDFGIVTCHGVNNHGEQTSPCIFQLVQGGPPSPVTECRRVQYSTHELDIICQPGYDGGRNQVFTMEVFYMHRDYIAANVTAEVPHMKAVGLSSGTQYIVQVYASNSRGRSKISKLETGTKKEYTIIEELQKPTINLNWFYIAGLPSLTAVCFALIFLAVLIMRSGNYSMTNDYPHDHVETRVPNPDLIPLNEGQFYRQPGPNSEPQSSSVQNTSFLSTQESKPDLTEINGQASVRRSCQCFECLLEDASLSAMASAPPLSPWEEFIFTPKVQNNYLYEV